MKTYWQGDVAEYTGRMVDGLNEIRMLEGHLKGQLRYKITEAESNARTVRNRSGWKDQQEQFKKLREVSI